MNRIIRVKLLHKLFALMLFMLFFQCTATVVCGKCTYILRNIITIITNIFF